MGATCKSHSNFPSLRPSAKISAGLVRTFPAAGGTPAGNFLSRSPWQRERLSILVRIMRRLDRAVAKGQPIGTLLDSQARHWRRRRYRTDPRRPLRFSASTLRRHWDAWHAGHRRPAALALLYRTPTQRIGPPQLRAMLRNCLRPGILSLRTAYRALARPQVTYDAYWHSIPVEIRRHIRALHIARRAARNLETGLLRSAALKTAKPFQNAPGRFPGYLSSPSRSRLHQRSVNGVLKPFPRATSKRSNDPHA